MLIVDKNNNNKKKTQRKGKLLTLRLFAQIQKSVSNWVHFQRGIYRLGSETARSCFQTAEREDTKACHGVQFLPASLLPLQRADLVSSPFLAELGWLPNHTVLLPLTAWVWKTAHTSSSPVLVTCQWILLAVLHSHCSPTDPRICCCKDSSLRAPSLLTDVQLLGSAPSSDCTWEQGGVIFISVPFISRNLISLWKKKKKTQVLVMWRLSKLIETKFLKEQ